MSLLGFQRRRRELAAKEAAEREATEKAVAEEKPLDKMTVDELKQYAADNDIDLGDATKKADILAAIKSESVYEPEEEEEEEEEEAGELENQNDSDEGTEVEGSES